MISERSRGYVLGAIAAASYGLNPLFALPLYGAGLGVDSVLFYRYVLAVVMLGALMLFRRQSFALRRRDVLPLAAMGVLFSVSSLLLFESYNLMDAGIASTILFVYPVMVAVIMAVGFRERVTAATVVSIALACGGISLLYKGGDGATLNLAGVVLVFLSAPPMRSGSSPSTARRSRTFRPRNSPSTVWFSARWSMSFGCGAVPICNPSLRP